MNRVTVAGLGIREFDHLTIESLDAIKNADRVLYLSTTGDRVAQRLQAVGVSSAEDLKPLYVDGAVDLDNYKALFKRIVSVSRVSGNVCVLLPGHPRVGVTIVHWFEQAKAELKIELKVLEGISSFCALINELAIDPLEYGAAILDANRILSLNQSLNPLVDTFIYHVCSIGVSETHLSDPSRENRLDLLQLKLTEYYSSNQVVYLVSASRGQGETTTKQSATVAQLQTLMPSIHFGSTLYIPAQSRRLCNESVR